MFQEMASKSFNLLIKQGTKRKELTSINEGLCRDNCRRRADKNYARSGLDARHSYVGQRKRKVMMAEKSSTL